MEFAVLTKDGYPIGKATGIAHVLTLCGIEYEHEKLETGYDRHPSELHIVANKRYVIGTWFERSYILKDKRSYQSELTGFTYHDALKRAVRDMFEKCRKEFMIVPL